MESLVDKVGRIAGLCGALGEGGGTIRIMEVCGTHTVSIARAGLRSTLPERIRLLSGPGCPVCVTDGSYVDLAVRAARGEGMRAAPVVATYGDMVRVPGSRGSLAEARASGATVALVYSADKAVELARKNAAREVIFLGVGFETTAPGTAVAVLRAREESIRNFSVLTAHKFILPAMRALLSTETAIDAFLCPGHVSVILGYGVYEELVRDHRKPCVVAGFEPASILEGVAEIVRQWTRGCPAACSVYPAASREGNRAAQDMLETVFEPVDAPWRGLGVIPSSGMGLRPEFAEFDAARKFGLQELPGREDARCRCGRVIAGSASPGECPLFAAACTPRDPVGPCMVSSEGACAAAYQYERR